MKLNADFVNTPGCAMSGYRKTRGRKHEQERELTQSYCLEARLPTIPQMINTIVKRLFRKFTHKFDNLSRWLTTY